MVGKRLSKSSMGKRQLKSSSPNSVVGRRPIPSIRPSIFTADPNLQTSRSEIASAGAERLITKNLTASATFLFARGVRLSRTRNVNLSTPVVLTPGNAVALGIPNPFPQQLGRLVFPPTRLSSQFDDIYQWKTTPVRFTTACRCP